MSNGTNTRPVKRRGWRWLLAFLVLVAVLVAGWQGMERYLNVERYLPMLTAQIQQRTGLPAAIGSVDLRLFPVPHLSGSDIGIGEGEFKAEAKSIEVWANLGGLLRRELDITSIEAEALTITLPEDSAEGQRRVQNLINHFTAKEPATPIPESASAGESGKDKAGVSVGGFTLRIGQITAPEVVLRQGAQEMTRCSITARDVLSGRLLLDIHAALPFLGADARLVSGLSLDQSGEGAPRLEGTAKIEHFDIEDLLGSAKVPHTRIGLEAKISGTLPGDLHADMSGSLLTDFSKAFSGAIQGKAVWSEGALTIQDAALTAPGLEFKAQARFVPGGEMKITIPSAAFTGEGLRVLLALAPLPGYALAAQESGALSLSNLVLGEEKGGEWKVLSGNMDVKGLDLAQTDGSGKITNISGSVQTADNALHIKELKSEGVCVAGDIRPDLAHKKIALNLNGDFTLSHPMVTAFLPKDTVRDLSGKCTLKKIQCTIVPGQGLPPDLRIDGEVASGKLSILTPSYQDRLSEMTATFTSDGNSVEGTATAASEHYGKVRYEGRFLLADQSLAGIVALDLPRAALSFVSSESTRPYAEAVFNAFGPSTFDLTYQPKNAKDKRMYLAVKRQGAPPLNATLYFDQRKDGVVLDALEVDSEIPVDSLRPVLPAAIHASGPASLHMTGGYPKGGFTADLNLSGAVIAAGEYLEKKKNAPLTVQVALGTKTNVFAPVSATVVYNQQPVVIRLDGPAPRIPELQVNLASFSDLLVKGGKASGQVTGSIDFTPPAVALHLDNAGWVFTPGAAIDSMTGDLNYASGNWNCKALSIRGADSDALIAASLENGRIDVQATGAKLNLNAVEAMYQAAASIASPDSGTNPAPPPAPAAAATAPPRRISGKGVVEVQSLYYRRARLSRVHTDLLFAENSLDLNNLSFGYGPGTAKGVVRILYGTPNTLTLDMAFQQVDLQLLDDLLFQEPRGFRGATSGPVKLSLPLASGQQFYRGINGTVDLQAEKGSYGKHGYATKVLAVLKSAEVLRLRIPSLKDEGLTFQKSGLKLASENGRMTIEKFTLDDPAYAMEGNGVIDLPADSMEVLLGLNILESVTGIADKVPVVGQVLDVLKSGTGFRIRASGSPFDPKVRLEPGLLPVDKEPELLKKRPGSVVRGLLDEVLRDRR